MIFLVFRNLFAGHRNVQLIYLTEIGGIGRSLFWFVTPFLVIALGGQNTELGDISGISTVIGVVGTLSVGFFSDVLLKRALWMGKIINQK